MSHLTKLPANAFWLSPKSGYRQALKRLTILLAVSIWWGLLINVSQAQTDPSELKIGIPNVGHLDYYGSFQLYEYPYFKDGYGKRFPSMAQSMDISTNFYTGAHYLIGEYFGPDYALLFSGLFDIIMPHPYIWLHEEWHRAIMSHRDISSLNESYFLTSKESDGVIQVSHVSDEDLARLKAEHPAEFVFLPTAGMISQIEQNRKLISQTFKYRTKSRDEVLLWLNALGVYSYMNACTNSSGDDITQKLENKQPEVLERDFTGLDCLSWVYDLHRPYEPYAARGVHPSGNGVDRYIKYSELTGREKNYLSNTVGLSLLNFVSPALFGFNSFEDGFSRWNFMMGSYMAPFGRRSFFQYFRADRSFYYSMTLNYDEWQSRGYGADLVITKYGNSGDSGFGISTWDQPRDQIFYNSAKRNWMFFLTYAQDFGFARFGVKLTTKGEGYVPGYVYLYPVNILETSIGVKY